MNRHILTGILFFLCICCLGTVHHVEAAVCPTSSSYAIIYYNHQRLHRTVGDTGSMSLAFGLSGPVGIKISPAGIVNAGNNTLNRTIDLVHITSTCDCLADTAESRVTVTVTGTCANGILNMQLHEVYPDSSALVTCTCDDGGGQYTQLYQGYTLSLNLKMDYVNGNTITQPYTCPDCSGTYSYRLQFTNEPPPSDALPLVPLAPLLYLLLR